ncbi:glycosyltransferase [Providencia manganoxydans]|uniref:glycosyltransferase n=1 Tax=Providencia manganoxydans TaxID=2923283 RepID=UPI0034DDC34B
MTKNVAFLLPSLRAVSPIKAAAFIANKLNSLGYNVVVISLTDEISDSVTLNKDIKLYTLGVRNWFLSLMCLSELGKILENENSRVCFSFLLPADFILSLSNSNIIKIAVMRDILETSFASRGGFFSIPIVRSLVKKIQALYLRRFDNVVAMTQDMRDYYRSILTIDPILIHNFLDENSTLSTTSSMVDFSPYRAEFNICVVGSLIPRKSIGEMLDFVETCFDKGLMLNLHVIGDGPLKNELIFKKDSLKLSSDNIIFHGHLDSPLNLIGLMDCYWSNSMSEGLSRAMMEACFLGVPCVVRKIEGINEFQQACSGVYMYKNIEECFDLFRSLNSDSSYVETKLGDEYREKNCIHKYDLLLRNFF